MLRCNIALGFLLLGCGSSPSPVDGGASDAPSEATVDAAPRCDPQGAPVDLTGVWAIRATLGVELRGRSGSLVRLCPDPQRTTAGLLFRVNGTAEGGRLRQQFQLCQVTLPRARGGAGECPMTPLSIQLSPSTALTSFLPRLMLPEAVTDQPMPAPCAPYRPPPFTVLLGVRQGALLDPERSALPAWCSPCMGTTASQCVCRDCMSTGAMCDSRAMEGEDSDGDGSPGVTVQVSAGEAMGPLRGDAFLAFRTRPTLLGEVLASDRVGGRVEATLEYALLGSNVTVLGATLDTAGVVSALPEFRFVAEESSFIMRRADGAARTLWDADGDGMVSCADILARAANFNR